MVPYMAELDHLISLPPNLVGDFSELSGSERDWFGASDPEGSKIGSGGGTCHLLHEAWRAENSQESFGDWLSKGNRVMIHAGGESRRLPAYGPSGKVLTPVPVFRWKKGQRIDQTLLDLQLPLLEQLVGGLEGKTLVASGDVLVHCESRLPELPDVDVLCVGLWSDPETASHHGVFFTPRDHEHELLFMLQKPTPVEINELAQKHNYLIDVGIWILSEKAIDVLMRKSGWSGNGFRAGQAGYYDLYSDFGTALGREPSSVDPECSGLSSAVVSLEDGGFYHFGRSSDLIASSHRLQNLVVDQRKIHSRYVKPHPEVFIQNADVAVPITEENEKVWIENSHIASGWTLSRCHVLTGVPENSWELQLKEGHCLDFIPVGESDFCVRAYGFSDAFRGPLDGEDAIYLGEKLSAWMRERNIPEGVLGVTTDLQHMPLFPVLSSRAIDGSLLTWLLHGPQNDGSDERILALWLESTRWSASEINAGADLKRLAEQRKEHLVSNLSLLARNHHRSVFFQMDLLHLEEKYGLALPQSFDYGKVPLAEEQVWKEAMLRERMQRRHDHVEKAGEAFTLLREKVLSPSSHGRPQPKMTVQGDQIVWARSPVRLDLAGGWSDTPPYCMEYGGKVVNVAVELNGQPPIQVFVKPGSANHIVLRSIDLGCSEELTSREQLLGLEQELGPFSIPKAALVLCGFLPQPSQDLRDQLQVFGGGLELTLLSAIPKGSGLGTSSILAATVLGALSDFCGLGWDLMEIGEKTLELEQMLTTGGGWQDQFGGILHGIKVLETNPGLVQRPSVRWLPDHLFTNPNHRDCMILYYTGITRLARNILTEIVEGMFLNSRTHLEVVEEIRRHGERTAEVLQRGDYDQLGEAVSKSWDLNQTLDVGTNPPEVQSIIAKVESYLLGLKLLGAGGGGYLLLMAKNLSSAQKIRELLHDHPPNDRARVVDFSLSKTGLQITRS